MQVQHAYSDESTLFLNVVPNETIEGIGIDHLLKAQESGRLKMIFGALPHEAMSVPYLMVCHENDLRAALRRPVMELNGGRVAARLANVLDQWKWLRKSGQIAVSHRFWAAQRFLASFYGGEHLIVFLNPYWFPAEAHELNKIERFYPVHRLNVPDVAVKERRKAAFAEGLRLFERMAILAAVDGISLSKHTPPYWEGLTIYAHGRPHLRPVIEKYQLFPYAEQDGMFVEKPLADVEQEVAERAAYWAAEAAFKSEVLTPLRERLEAAGCRVLGKLDLISRSEDGTWRIFVTPADQSRYESGWRTVDDLIAWLEGKGPMIMGPATPA